MTSALRRLWMGWATVMAALALLGCGGGDDAVPLAPPPAVGSATIGAAGGTVDGPDGVQLVVPPDALSGPVTIRIARNAAGAPALPAEAGQVATYEITPHDLAFAFPAQLRLPLAAPAGASPVAMAAAPGGDWAMVPATFGNGVATIERATLSYFSGWACAIGAGNADPYPCVQDLAGVTDMSTTPAGGYEVIPWPGNVVVRAFTAPVTARYRLSFVSARDCSDGRLTVRRIEVPVGGPARPAQVELAGQSITLTPSGISSASTGTFDFVTQVGAAQNGTLTFGFDFTCTRGYQNQRRFATSYDSRLVRIAPPPAAPTITQQPANAAVTAGSATSFTVLASGAATLTYTWERSNDNGATWQALGAGTAVAGGSSLGLTAALADDRAQFRAQVCSVTGAQQSCITTSPALLAVTPAATVPTFSNQPADVTVVAGQTASFTAVAVGLPATQVRWQVAGPGSSTFADVGGEPACAPTAAPGSGTQTASTCTIAQTAAGNSGSRYRAVAVNAAAPTGVPSDAATLTINAAPTAPAITTQPAPQAATVGGSATFGVVATGTAPLSYLWRVNGLDLTGPGPFIVGACTGNAALSGASVTLSNLGAGCNGVSIAVVVSNGIAPNASSNPATLSVTAGRPIILQSPQSQTVDVGQPATFAVQASGTNLTYQWQRNRRNSPASYGLFEDIANATADSYTTPPATLGDDATLFAVRVCNGAAQPPTYPSCWFIGQMGDVQLTIREVVGQHFALVASGTTQDLNDVAFANASQGAAVGNAGTLLYTFDGGQTWLPAGVQGATVTRDIRAVALAANGNGVAVGPGVLLITNTFGSQWREAVVGDPLDFGCCSDVAFAGTTGWMSPASFGVRGFARWDGSTVFGFPSVGPLEASRVEFGNATAGTAIARPGDTIHYTTNGGVDWLVAAQPPAVPAQVIAYAGPTVVLAASPSGVLLRSTDAGATWSALFGGGVTRPTEGLAFNGAGVGLAVGQGPSFGLMRTANSGLTWIPMSLPGLGGTLKSVAFADANVAVAVGEGGAIVRFSAGGL